VAFAVDLTGTILDRRYRITGLLGKGGMGHVYEAVHVALDQRVAVKVLHPRYAYEERFRERFLQEARSASKIKHPNVVEIKDFGDTPDGSVYFAMEYLQGHDVGVELQRHGALPWSRARGILLQATSALGAAHAKRIIHRDIKPGNCFLIEDEAEGMVDVVKLLDFGIAKVGSDSHADAQGKGLTGTGEVFGTASYMSPEQARGQTLDARSDMYSLGIMAYEMLTGQAPFIGVNAIHVITLHLNERPEPLRTHDPEIPAVVEAVVLKMIAKAPRDRYESMEALEQALQAIAATVGEKGRRTRLWSSPGDLRALVEEKKGASAQVLPPGGVGAGAVVGTDVERTNVVVPGGAGGVRKVAAGAMGWAPAAKGLGGAARGAVAPGGADRVEADGANAAIASARHHAATPIVGSSAALVAPPVAGGFGYGGAVAVASGSGPQGDMFGAAVMGESVGGVVGAYADGPNPPPGRNDRPRSAASWPPSTASTGPHRGMGDTGSETRPHSLDVGRAPGLSGGLVAVVVVLVLLVGGASAMVTMMFLYGRGAEPHEAAAAGEHEAEDFVVERSEGEAPARASGEGERASRGPGPGASPTRVEAEGLEETKQVEARGEIEAHEAGWGLEEAPRAQDGGVAVPGAVEDGLVGEGDGGDGEHEGDRSAEQPQEPRVEPTSPREATVPEHETEKCARTRELAGTALGERKWEAAYQQTRQKKCWSPSERSSRRRMQVMALMELKRWGDCVKAGAKATDRETVKMVEICRKKTE
jgi:tRNA A-37 threonylcarbamoyl transferase component Bud32